MGGFLFGNEFDLGQWPDHRPIRRSHVTGALRAPPRPRFELEELLWRGFRFGECRGTPPSSTMGANPPPAFVLPRLDLAAAIS